jgi:integrase
LLNETVIQRAKPNHKAYRLSDTLGLFLWVTPSGGKLWRWKYRHAEAAKTISYGKWPDVSLETARERHFSARKLLASGVDPMAQRAGTRRAVATSAAHSFQTVAGLWLEHWRAGKSPRHADVTRRRLEKNVFPLLGSRPLDAIVAPELVVVVKAIEARGVGDLAKRSLETCGQIFRYAIAHGYATRNPAADIKPADLLKPTVKTHLARVSQAELPALLRAVEIYQGKVLTRLAMKLLSLTAVRTSELIGAQWAEFDTSAKRWNIPATRMKLPAPHIIPLSRQSLEVLELLKGLSGHSPYLFPGDRGATTMSNMAILQGLKRMGYAGRMTGHGWRGLFSTILHENGWNHEWIELQLAHSPRDQVSAAYNFALHLENRGKMMDWWGDFLERTQRGVAR